MDLPGEAEEEEVLLEMVTILGARTTGGGILIGEREMTGDGEVGAETTDETVDESLTLVRC